MNNNELVSNKNAFTSDGQKQQAKREEEQEEKVIFK